MTLLDAPGPSTPARGTTSPTDPADTKHGNPHARPSGLRRFGHGLRARADLLIGLGLFVVVALVQGIGALGFPGLADDEGTYVSQAWAVQNGELAHYTYWYDHPPLGWIQLAMFQWIPELFLPDAQPVASARLVVVGATALSAVLLYMLGRNLGISRVFSAAGTLLAFVGPLSVVMQREVYLDNVAMPWVIGAFVLATNKRGHLWLHVASGFAFAVAVLSKETLVVLLPALVWALVSHSHPRTRAFSLSGLIGGLGLVVLFYPLMALLRGELFAGTGHVSLWDAIAFQLLNRPSSGAVWDASSGAHEIVAGWVYYDSWLLILGLIAVPFALAIKRLRPIAIAALSLVIIGLNPGTYLPAMYVIGLLPFLGLTAAGVGDVVWRWAWARRGAWRVVVVAPVTVGLLALVAAIGISWAPGTAHAMTTDVNQTRMEAEDWIRENAAGATVLVDDVAWPGLVIDGSLPRERVIWFYKLDTDTEINQKLYPGGWRDMCYALSTDQWRYAIYGNPALEQNRMVKDHSQVVATFGEGESQVQILKVEGSNPGACGQEG